MQKRLVVPVVIMMGVVTFFVFDHFAEKDSKAPVMHETLMIDPASETDVPSPGPTTPAKQPDPSTPASASPSASPPTVPAAPASVAASPSAPAAAVSPSAAASPPSSGTPTPSQPGSATSTPTPRSASMTPVTSFVPWPSASQVFGPIWKSVAAPTGHEIVDNRLDGWDYERELPADVATLPLCPLSTMLTGEWYFPPLRFNASCRMTRDGFAQGRDDCMNLKSSRNKWNFTENFFKFRPFGCVLNVPRDYHQLRVLLYNRTIMYLGDSVGHNTFLDTVCDWEQSMRASVNWYYPLVKVEGGFVTQGTNVTMEYLNIMCARLTWWWRGNASSPERAETRICILRAGGNNLPFMPVGISEAVTHFCMTNRDVMMVNQGLHGVGPELPGMIADSMRRSRQAIAEMGGNAPLFVWRETFPQHFAGASGAYMPNLLREQCGDKPMVESNINQMSNPVVLAAGMPFLWLWNATAPRREEHHGEMEGTKGNYDCTHYCVPSSPLRLSTQMLLHHVASLRP